jgi:selenocysteine-specific elongation factor
MRVIGTAGHIDHGKSALIEALTGATPMHIPEEHARGMTIELGFAYIDLPRSGRVGVVDVPGHRRFVRTMAAGAFGLDVVVFVVAADDGWMPQTEEHLRILDVLGVTRGVVALTKRDLVDEKRLADAKEEIAIAAEGTFLAGAPIVPVSSLLKLGLDDLVSEIDAVVGSLPPVRDIARPIIWADRSFALHGAGRVITGTLRDGSIRVGETLYAYPGAHPVRVRKIQVHGGDVERAEAQSRTAINLVADADIDRGTVFETTGALKEYESILAYAHLFPGTAYELRRATEVEILYGTSKLDARVAPAPVGRMAAGEKRLVRIDFAAAFPVRIGDRFLIYSSAKETTVGGGVFLRPLKGRREGAQALEHLLCASGFDWLNAAKTPAQEHFSKFAEEMVRAVVAGEKVMTEGELMQSCLSESEIERGIERASGEGVAFDAEFGAIVDASTLTGAKTRVAAAAAAHFREHPLADGVTPSEVSAKSGVVGLLLDVALRRLVKEGALVAGGVGYKLPQSKQVEPPTAKSRVRDEIIANLIAHPFAAPSVRSLYQTYSKDKEVIAHLLRTGDIVELAEGIAMAREVFDKASAQIVDLARKKGMIKVADVRDLIGAARKYVVGILEEMDKRGVTKRQGEGRILRPGV